MRSGCAGEETCAQLLQTDVSRFFVQFTSEPEKSLDPSAASTQLEECAGHQFLRGQKNICWRFNWVSTSRECYCSCEQYSERQSCTTRRIWQLKYKVFCEAEIWWGYWCMRWCLSLHMWFNDTGISVDGVPWCHTWRWRWQSYDIIGNFFWLYSGSLDEVTIVLRL